uniref:Aldehyde dehydrogenase 16 family, member A1 n=1 Tax=Paramormyrops kingsleyae TaxID=1676925 RepID=A0A3B3Q8W7_9TELE|nr:aldehyde dehydrogenase family 16 member A1 [Paramormyrops kingsleyae]
MAGSSSKTVFDVFRSMEYAPSAPSSAAAQAWLDVHSRSLGFFINGQFVRPAGRQASVLTDASGGSVCSILCASDDDVSLSVSAAKAAFRAWSGLTCPQRARVLRRWAAALQRYAQCLAELCELSQSPSPAAALVRLLQYYASWAQLRDAQLPGWSPVGVVALLLSDDASAYSLLLKAMAALSMGNTVILKPGTGSALPALLLASLGGEAGLPAGAINVVMGQTLSLGVTVARYQHISCVTYSGNEKEGRALSREMAGTGVPVWLSLSSSAVCPFIIFDSADIDSAVDGVIEAAFKKKRDWRWVLCVQESVWDVVAARLKIRMAEMKCVPLLAESDRATVDIAVQEAAQQGATVIQPCPPPSSSAAYPPTVLWGVAPSCPSAVSPPPGPVLPALCFRTTDEGITLGNHSPHGQAGCLWTEDLTLALEAARGLSMGSVWLNSHSVLDPSLPISGAKESGNCTDGGREGLFQFLRPSTSCCLPPSSPLPMDYTTFGSTVSGPSAPAEHKSDQKVPRSFLQLVGGRLCKSDSGCNVAVRTAGGEVLAYCPDSGRKDVRDAVEAALKVQPGWMKKGPASRSQSLYRLSECLNSKRQDMTKSLSTQTGLPLEDAEKEVDLSVSRLCDCAALCDKERGGVQSLLQSGSALSLPESIGVVGVVLPDSRPLLSLVSLLGAAVAAGNAVVMVPSEKYPLLALEFIQILQFSDIPGGVVSILTGRRDHLTQALANHSVIQAIWYWGNQEGRQYLQYTCSGPLKRLWLNGEDKEMEASSGVARDWTSPDPTLLEEVWARASRWKSVWIPTA